jgi:putative heme-binding domain-containing protein
MYRSLLVLASLILLPSLSWAQANAKIPDPDPEIERKTFKVADGFEVNLFAGDPLLAKPIQMNFDSRGRLWIASSEIYPHIEPGKKANDKIIILEDTDNDGKADKTTVFADGLLIPTGIEPGDGGAYVANSTELLHMSASKEGGKADKTRVVLSGFGTEDTHHILHTLRWGPEGLLYFNQSIYIHSHIETPHGVKRLNGGGIWRFRPETLELDVFVRGFVNTWGHHFDRYGQSLITDGAYGEGVNHGVPGAYYVTAVGATRILNGMNPGSPKHCGLEILGGTHLPEEFRGNVITNDFRGHKVNRFVLRDDGSTYQSTQKPDLIQSTHPAFRPIDVKMGPDGAIYIADWYNPIIQHGEIDFRDPRRDHTHGRIWRITAKNRPLVKKPDLVNAKTPELLEQLKSPEDWNRHHAKRVLKERGAKEVLPSLEKWVESLDAKQADYESHLLEAAWMFQALDQIHDPTLQKILSAKEGKVRSAAIRIVSQYLKKIPNAQAILEKAVQDEHPRVRLEAVRALGQISSPKATEIALRALDRPVDKVIDYALWLTVRELEPAWMPAFKEGAFDFGGDPKKVAFALQAAGSPSAVQPLLTLVKSDKLTAEKQEPIWLLIAQLGGPKELQAVFERISSDKLNDTQRTALLNALEESARTRKVKPDGSLDKLSSFIESKSLPLSSAAIRLAGLWKLAPLAPTLSKLASGKETDADQRKAAIEGLVSLNTEESKKSLLALAGKESDPLARREAIAGLSKLDPSTAVDLLLDFANTVPVTDELAEVFAAFLQRKEGAAQLQKKLETAKLPPDAAKLALRAVRNSGQDFTALAATITKAGNLTTQAMELKPKELEAMVQEVLQKGDPARGELVYRRKDLNCMSCHAIGGAGGQVGPELISIGASAPVDYLIESILNPNKAVKEGYHALRVVTLDGKVLTGVKIRETKTEMTLRTPEDKEVKILIEDIENKAQTRSLMPDGLADGMTRQELLDLTRFLSELGKVGPYSPSKAKLIRRWEAVSPTRDGMTQLRANSLLGATTPNPAIQWQPAYTKVSGLLPLEELPSFTIFNGMPKMTMVKGQLDVTTPGKVKLKVNSTKGLTLWLGSTPIEVKEEMTLDLKAGIQNLHFGIDLTQRKEPLSCEMEDIADSPARVSIVTGK